MSVLDGDESQGSGGGGAQSISGHSYGPYIPGSIVMNELAYSDFSSNPTPTSGPFAGLFELREDAAIDAFIALSGSAGATADIGLYDVDPSALRLGAERAAVRNIVIPASTEATIALPEPVSLERGIYYFAARASSGGILSLRGSNNEASDNWIGASGMPQLVSPEQIASYELGAPFAANSPITGLGDRRFVLGVRIHDPAS